MSDPDAFVPQHDLLGQHNVPRQSIQPLRQFVHHRPDDHSPFDKVLEECKPEYLGDPGFKAFAAASQFRIISYSQWAKEFMALKTREPDQLPPEFGPEFGTQIWDVVWTVEPTCPKTVFGYMREELDDELALAVKRKPYEYFKLYMTTARENPKKIWELFGSEKGSLHQQHVRQAVRKILGAAAATEEFAKKIYERNGGNPSPQIPESGDNGAIAQVRPPEAGDNGAKAKVEAFKKEADFWMTREQVEQWAHKKYLVE